MIKRMTAAILACLMCITLLCGCTAGQMRGQAAADDRLTVICTVFPVYDWARNITRGTDKIDVRMLSANGGDLHSFQPSAKDIADIKNSALFVYIGGNSDKWADDIADESPMLKTLRLFDVLGDSLAEENDGNVAFDHSHGGADHIHSDGSVHDYDEHEEHDEKEYDEHVWLSLRLAEKAVLALNDAIAMLESQNADIYKANTAEYVAALRDLDAEYAAATEKSRDKTVILADRFPFLYLMRDYGITCYAAFPGCSSDTQASFSTVVYLIERLNEHKKSAVLVLEGSNQSVAETVIADSTQKGAAVEIINSCQSVTARDIKNGTSYLDIMKGNLAAITHALQ